MEYPNECWYWSSKLGVGAIPPRAIRYLKQYPVSARELTSQLESLEAEAISAIDNVHFRNVAKELPSAYVPEVRPVGRDFRWGIKIVNAVKAPVIAVSLEKFYSGIHDETRQLLQAKRQGIHRYLGYDGEVLLTTDVRDQLCDYLVAKPDYFAKTINQLSPDYVTTLDSYTYCDLPTYIATINIRRTLKTLPSLQDLQCKVIGLVLGSNTGQVLAFAESLVRCGIKLLAYPSYEHRRHELDILLRRRIRILKAVLKLPVLALSCSADPKWDTSADYYSSLSWFPFSRDEGSYLKDGTRTLLRKIIRAKSAVSQTRLEDFGRGTSLA